MHEVGMCEGLLETVKTRAEDRPVAEVGVRVGAALRVAPDAFQQSFELVAAGTVAEGAYVELVTVPVTASCRDCGSAFESTDPALACSACGSTNVDANGGDDLMLEWLRYSEPDSSDEQQATTPASAEGQ